MTNTRTTQKATPASAGNSNKADEQTVLTKEQVAAQRAKAQAQIASTYNVEAVKSDGSGSPTTSMDLKKLAEKLSFIALQKDDFEGFQTGQQLRKDAIAMSKTLKSLLGSCGLADAGTSIPMRVFKSDKPTLDAIDKYMADSKKDAKSAESETETAA